MHSNKFNIFIHVAPASRKSVVGLNMEDAWKEERHCSADISWQEREKKTFTQAAYPEDLATLSSSFLSHLNPGTAVFLSIASFQKKRKS